MIRGVVFEEHDLPDLKTVDGIADSEGKYAAWLRDTEGSIINIAEMKSTHGRIGSRGVASGALTRVGAQREGHLSVALSHRC